MEPRRRDRLVDIGRNLTDRIAEARANGRLGEVQGFQVSLDGARRKLATLERLQHTETGIGPVSLGMPIISG